MIGKVLVAIDGLERSSRVFRCAVELAASLGSSIHLLSVVAVPPELRRAGDAACASHPPSYLLRDAEARLRAFAARAPHLRIETLVYDSLRPWRAIIHVSDQIGADLIVVGSHSYHGLDYLLGTANLIRRNVLVVDTEPDVSRKGSSRHAAEQGAKSHP